MNVKNECDSSRMEQCTSSPSILGPTDRTDHARSTENKTINAFAKRKALDEFQVKLDSIQNSFDSWVCVCVFFLSFTFSFFPPFFSYFVSLLFLILFFLFVAICTVDNCIKETYQQKLLVPWIKKKKKKKRNITLWRQTQSEQINNK